MHRPDPKVGPGASISGVFESFPMLHVSSVSAACLGVNKWGRRSSVDLRSTMQPSWGWLIDRRSTELSAQSAGTDPNCNPHIAVCERVKTLSSKSLGTNSYNRNAREKFSSYSVNTDHRFKYVYIYFMMSRIYILLIQHFQFNQHKSVSNHQLE